MALNLFVTGVKYEFAALAFNKRLTATVTTPTVTSHLISAQRWLQIAGGAGTGVKASELA
jgi:hypothetical protein